MYRIFALAAVAGLPMALVSPAQADGLGSPYFAEQPEPYAYAADGYAAETTPHFDGAYVGLIAAAGLSILPVIDREIAAVAGYNFNMGNGYVAGAEVDASFNPMSLWGPDAFTGTIDGRLGYVVTDNMMLYGRAGGGYTTGAAGSAVWDVGGGADFYLNDSFGVRGELDRVDPLTGGMQTQINAKLGIILDF